MSEEDRTLKDLFPPNPHELGTPLKPTPAKKRRRKGQLNDGEWAPGYGPDAKKIMSDDDEPFKLSDRHAERFNPDFWDWFRDRYWWWQIVIIAVAIVGVGIMIGLSTRGHHH